MTQLQQSTLALPPPAPHDDQFMVVHQGKQFIVMSVDSFHAKQSNHRYWLLMASSLGFLAAAIVALVLDKMQAPAAIVPPAPVIVEKPVAIPTTVKPHCIAFCGSN